MARKTRKPVLDFAVYVAVRAVVGVIQAVPPRVAFRLADFVGWLAHRVDKRHREVAADNVRHAFPELPPSRVDAIVRATYRHFARVAFEIVLFPRKIHVTSWRRYIDMYAAGAIRSLVSTDRPVLAVTAHFGNWELAGWMLGLVGLKTYAIARVLDNPHLERFLKKLRQGTGQEIIAKKDDFDRLEAVLRAGGIVATLADQDAGPRGVFVNFFGRPASTHKAVALMAIEFDAPLLVVGVPRVDPCAAVAARWPASERGEPIHYAATCEEVIDPRDYAGEPGAVRAITERYTAALERLIRRHPEQYFWLHRRWKSQPKAKMHRAAA